MQSVYSEVYTDFKLSAEKIPQYIVMDFSFPHRTVRWRSVVVNLHRRILCIFSSLVLQQFQCSHPLKTGWLGHFLLNIPMASAWFGQDQSIQVYVMRLSACLLVHWPSMSYLHWWHMSGSEDEGQWPDIISTCKRSTNSYPSTWRSQESRNRCGIRYRKYSIKNAESLNWNTVPKPGHRIQQ